MAQGDKTSMSATTQFQQLFHFQYHIRGNGEFAVKLKPVFFLPDVEVQFIE